MSNKISTAIEFTTETAKSGLSSLKSEVNNAEGAFGKLKAGVGGVKSMLGNFLSGPGGVVAAGGAIAAAGEFALSAVEKFSALGVEVGHVSDATGLSTDEASRWIEVAKQMNIDSGTLEGTIGKMNKAAGNTPDLFKNAGIEIAHTKDGVIDVNQTFLNAVDRLNGIKDTADKTRLAAKLFGKGWQSMAELIGKGSGELVGKMEEVSKARVLSPEQVEKARQFHEAMVQLKDSMGEVTLEAGSALAPALTGVAGVLKEWAQWLPAVFSGLGSVADAIGRITQDALHLAGIKFFDSNIEQGVRATESMQNVGQAATGATTAVDALSVGTDVLTAAQKAAAAAVKDSRDKIDALKLSVDAALGSVDGFEGSSLTLADSMDGLATKTAAADKVLKDSKSTDEEKAAAVRGVREEVIATGDQALITAGKYATEQGAVEGTTGFYKLQRDALLMMQQQYPALRDQIQQYIDILNNIPGVVNTTVQVNSRGDVINAGLKGARAAGGPVSEGDYLVGEKGPEVVHMGGSGTVIPNDALGGGTVIKEVHVHVQSMPSPNELIRLVKQYEARNGPGWRK